MDDDERALETKVSNALADAELPVAHVVVEVDRSYVILRGNVPDMEGMHRIESVVAAVDGVSHVLNRLVVATP